MVSWYSHFRPSLKRGRQMWRQFAREADDHEAVFRGVATASGPALDRGEPLMLIQYAPTPSGLFGPDWYADLQAREVGVMTGLWESMHLDDDGKLLVDEWWSVDSPEPLCEQVRRTVLAHSTWLVRDAATLPLDGIKNPGKWGRDLSDWMTEEIVELIAYRERELIERFGYEVPHVRATVEGAPAGRGSPRP